MAEAAILAAAKALGGALLDEAVKYAISQLSELLGLDSRIANINNELLVMQAFLHGINTHDCNDEAFNAWLAQVRNLAYHIQDIVDEFIYITSHEKFGGVRFYMKKLFKDPKSLKALKQIASQLKKAEITLNKLAMMKDRWVSPSNTGISNNPYYSNEISHNVAISAHFIGEDKLVGVDTSREILTNWIHSEGSNVSVISVWGMGGLGKTTLVTNVFKREKNKFDCSAWVSVSQTYTDDHLVQKLIHEICESMNMVPIDTTTMDVKKLKETLLELLNEKRYLIILDDIWIPKAFESVRDALVDNHKGSRIIITSRNEDVANLAPKRHRFKLEALDNKESCELFFMNAFQIETDHPSFQTETDQPSSSGSTLDHKCPPYLQKIALEIISKCEGLPLALVSIGKMLSLGEKSVIEWERVRNQLSWELEHNESFDHLRNILKLSFNRLPRNLKNCFLYCCMFPEDHLIRTKKIIRLWVAEGFIEERGASTLEEVAEGYLVELIRRSMLQLVEANYFGRVKRCRMHDTLRELGLSLCMKENFSLMHEDNKIVKVDTTVRRLSIIKSSNEISLNATMSQLRTFLSFDPSLLSSLLSLTLLKSRYLTVLDLEGLPIETLPNTIGDLFNLRYLGLRKTKLKFLPNSIEKLHNLQTLDLYNSHILQLHNSIVKLKKMRHLFSQILHDETFSSLQSLSGISLPSKDIIIFKDLQTLQALEANDEVVKELGNLTQLRSFRIVNMKESYCADLCKALSNMSLLSFLAIFASDENEFIQLEHLNTPPLQLQLLELSGRLKENIFESPLFQIPGKNLQTLGLHWSRLQNDPFPSLSHLSNLTSLYLTNRAYDGQQLVFRDGWFPKLKFLGLKQLPSLIQVEMEKGTMVNVEQIDLRHMKQLVEIPKGVEHLIALKELYCEGLSDNFGGLVKGFNLLSHFICHIMP